MKHGIFLSYRRSDSRDVTGRIYDLLVEQFGDDAVFRDIDSIPITSLSFPEFLEQALRETRVVLVVVGPDWVDARDETGQRRLDDEGDFVRIEVETALRLGMPVVPLLVGDAEVPTPETLPESIRELTVRNAVKVRPDPDFHGDMQRLTELIADVLGTRPEHKAHLKGRIEDLERQSESVRSLDNAWDRERSKYRVWYCFNALPNAATLLLISLIFAVPLFMLCRVGYGTYQFNRLSSMSDAELNAYLLANGNFRGNREMAESLVPMLASQLRTTMDQGRDAIYAHAVIEGLVWFVLSFLAFLILLNFIGRYREFRKAQQAYEDRRRTLPDA